MTSTRVPLHQRVLTDEQRQEIANREVERQRVAAIFTPTDELNVDAIKLLIGWAEQDQRALGEFRLWGTWDQGHWGHAEVDLDQTTRDAVEIDDYDDVVNRDEAFDVIDKGILNGACQMAYCMAGQAVAQAGYKLVYDAITANDMLLSATADSCVAVEPTGTFDDRGFPVVQQVGEPKSIQSTAAEILGLDYEQADLFFSGSNEIGDLKAYANYFARDAGVDLPYPDHYVWGEDDADDDL